MGFLIPVSQVRSLPGAFIDGKKMKKKILIVEDELNFRELLVEFLEYKGYEVIPEINGRNALKYIEKSGYPDLVLTDIIMEEMEGIELINILKKKNPELKILVMSGGGKIGADSYLKIVEVLGVSGILKKPFKLERLLELIENNI